MCFLYIVFYYYIYSLGWFFRDCDQNWLLEIERVCPNLVTVWQPWNYWKHILRGLPPTWSWLWKGKTGSIGVIYYGHFSLSTWAGISSFLPLFDEEERLFGFFWTLKNILSLISLSPICATWCLLHISVCCLDTFEPFGDGSYLCWTIHRSGFVCLKAVLSFLETTIWQEKSRTILSH